MKAPLIFFAVIITAFGTLLAGTISPEEAKNHIGETVTVSGHVDEFHAAARASFLDMGGRYPHETFSAVSFPKSGISLDELSHFEGKTISVTGKIKLYHGRPEIILTSLGQISEQWNNPR